MPHEVVFLSDHDVRDMVTMSDAMAAVEEDFKRQAIPESMVYGVPLAYSTDDRQLGYRSRIKSAIIRDLPVAGVRVTGFKIDQNGVGTGGGRTATRYIILSDPVTSSPIAIIDERSSFAIAHQCGGLRCRQVSGPSEFRNRGHRRCRQYRTDRAAGLKRAFSRFVK